MVPILVIVTILLALGIDSIVVYFERKASAAVEADPHIFYDPEFNMTVACDGGEPYVEPPACDDTNTRRN